MKYRLAGHAHHVDGDEGRSTEKGKEHRGREGTGQGVGPEGWNPAERREAIAEGRLSFETSLLCICLRQKEKADNPDRHAETGLQHEDRSPAETVVEQAADHRSDHRRQRAAPRRLLAAGVRGIEGRFGKGDAVSVRLEGGAEIGRGLTRYDAADAERICGLRSDAIEGLLGYTSGPVIHADDLAVALPTPA